MTRLAPTASQTVGPFFHDCLMRAGAACDALAPAGVAGVRIRVAGRVTDGDGAPVTDAVLELWQANHHGRYHHPADRRDLPLEPAFVGHGRVATDAEGRYAFSTIKPGAVPLDASAAARLQAPHVVVAVHGRGLLGHLCTRLYFDDEPANADDPVLLRVPPERRATLVARRAPEDDETGTVAGTRAYRFDVVLQGEGETVFFDFTW